MVKNFMQNELRALCSFILLLLLNTIVHAQQITIEGCVTDEVTGEKLIFATVYSTKSGKGTVTNYDGDFSIKVDSDEMLCFSYVGYEKRTIKASDMPKNIALTPWDVSLPEVTVIAEENILQKATRKLNEEFKQHSKDRSQYFMRMNVVRHDSSAPQTKDSADSQIINLDNQRLEIAEAFIAANSMGNLRNAEVIKGIYGRKTTHGLEDPKTNSLNFHHVMEAGPWIEESPYWAYATSPLKTTNDLRFLLQTYDIKQQLLQDSTGTKYYLFEFNRKNKNRFPNGIVTGKLYMNANTLQLLRFEGRVEDILLKLSKDAYLHELFALDISIDITFQHTKGYTEIANMACTMSSSNMETKSVLFNVDDIDLKTGSLIDNDAEGEKGKYKIPKGKALDNDMLETISKAGFNKELWRNSNIVKRTNEEQKVLGMDEGYSEDLLLIKRKRKR